MITVSAGCEYMGGIHGSGFVSTAENVLQINVVCVVRGVGGLCKMCMCLTRAGYEVWGKWVRGLGLVLPIMYKCEV